MRAVSARDPYAAARLNEQGLALVERDDCAQAEERFRQALSADPFCGPAHNNLGVALLKLGRVYDAGWSFQYACKLMPKAAAPRANLGLLFEQCGRYDEAERELTAALADSPQDVEIMGHLARVHVRRGKHTSDTNSWLQAVASQDDDPAWRSWARLQLTRNHANSESGR